LQMWFAFHVEHNTQEHKSNGFGDCPATYFRKDY